MLISDHVPHLGTQFLVAPGKSHHPSGLNNSLRHQPTPHTGSSVPRSEDSLLACAAKAGASAVTLPLPPKQAEG